MKKKTLSILLLTCTLTAAVTGCSSKKAEAGESQVVVNASEANTVKVEETEKAEETVKAEEPEITEDTVDTEDVVTAIVDQFENGYLVINISAARNMNENCHAIWC